MSDTPPKPPAFTFEALEAIYRALTTSFEVRPLCRALDPAGDRPIATIRHDLDLSPRLVAPFAALERGLGIPATYHVVTDSPLYDIAANGSILADLRDQGHEVGAHVDVSGALDVGREIEQACAMLARVTGEDVQSVSFHYPSSELLRGRERIAGRVNAYSARLMKWYLSDSRGVWVAGDPIDALRHASGPILQILIHPIWWGERPATPPERLQTFFEASTKGSDPESTERFSEAMVQVVTDVARSGSGSG